MEIIRRWSSVVPCEKLRRAMSIPDLISCSIISTVLLAGPSVATIFVLQSISLTSYPFFCWHQLYFSSWITNQPLRPEYHHKGHGASKGKHTIIIKSPEYLRQYYEQYSAYYNTGNTPHSTKNNH